MGQCHSVENRPGDALHAIDRKKSVGLRERLQLLEDLVHGQSRERRQELLLQLPNSDGSQHVGHSILPKAPEEFKLGSLIAAGSYGRVYAGTYRGQPAALKLLTLDEESAAAILNEVRLCLKLNHRNLVRLLDCAVVGTSTHSFVTSSELDGASGFWMRGAGQQGDDYLPVLPGSDLLINNQEGTGYGLLSPAGHACFEVWIAMELCDGGTLAQQVAQGFQYCPETRQVDMKVLDGQPGSEAGANSCCGDSVGECSWLQLLCHNGSKPIMTRCRRCSNDSCWSFCRSSSSKECTGGSSSSGSSSPITESYRGRSRSGQLLSLSGLCCVTSSGACLGEDDDDPYRDAQDVHDDDESHPVSTGCLACVGLPALLSNSGVQDLDHSGSSLVSCATDEAEQQQQQRLRIVPTICSALAGDEVFTLQASQEAGAAGLKDRVSGQQPLGQQDVLRLQQVPSDDVHEEEHIAPLSLYTTAREHRRSRRLSRTGVMPNVQAALAAAAATGRLPLDSGLAKYMAGSRGSSSGSSAAEANTQSGSEEDGENPDVDGTSAAGMLPQPGHQTEQQPQSLLPRFAVCGDLAEKVPSAMVGKTVAGVYGSGSAAGGDGLDDLPQGFAAGCMSLGRLLPGQAVYARQQQPRSRRHSYCYGLSGASMQLAPSTSLLRQQYTCSHAGISAAEAAAAIAAAAGAVREEMAAAKGARVSAPVSEPRSAGRRRKPRRMSYDDLLAQQPSSPYAVSFWGPFKAGDGEAATGLSGLGRLPAALRRGSGSDYSQSRRRRMSWDVRMEVPSTAAAPAGPRAPARGKSGQRTRRHSWTCAYLGDVKDAAHSTFSLRGLPSCLLPQEASLSRHGSGSSIQDAESSSQQLLINHGDGDRAGSSSSSSTVASAGSSKEQSWGGLGSRRRRTRRHSWAGFMTEQQSRTYAAGFSSKVKAPRHLSLCFSSSEAGHDADDYPRRASFQLPTCVSCCTDGSYLPLDDPAAAGAQEPLLNHSEHSSSSMSGAQKLREPSDVAMGCLGRLGAKSGGSRSSKGRRRSWCCGSTGAEHSLGAWSQSSGNQWPPPVTDDSTASASAASGSSSSADKVTAAGRFGRRSSWDVACYSGSLASAATASASGPLPEVQQWSTHDPLATIAQQTSSQDQSSDWVPHKDLSGCALDGARSSCAAASMPLAQAGCSDKVQPLGTTCSTEHLLLAAEERPISTTREVMLPSDVLTGPMQQGTSTGAPQLDGDLPEQLFVGSFDCKPSDGSRHSSGLSSRVEHKSQGPSPVSGSSTEIMPLALFGASVPSSASLGAIDLAKSSMAGGKERRWSTGVAAHDLLLRQQMLAQQKDGVKVRRASAYIPGEVADIFDAPLPAPQQESTLLKGTPSCGQVVNVLGMPTNPASSVNQRRMSYDTATGAYLLVGDQADTAGLSCIQQSAFESPGHSQQRPGIQQTPQQWQQQQTAEMQAQPVQQHIGRHVHHQPQQQPAEVQQHMQRLMEALNKKGYAGVSFDNTDMPTPPRQEHEHLQTAAALPSAAVPVSNQPPAVATPQPSLQLQDQTQQSPAHCVPPAYSRPRFCAKVCDFGFSQCLRAGQSHCSTFNAGTITHQAPEVLKNGRLSPAADVYAFGIILWELLTGERPFRGLLEGDLVYGVCEQGLRPRFPPGAPQAYVELAQQCWAENAADRPTTNQLLRRLNELLYEVRRQEQLGANSVNSHSSAAPGNRPRRHSMPVVGSGRRRRASRRFSLFLPFARQPVSVPEHEVLEQNPHTEAATYSGVNAAAISHAHHATGSSYHCSSKEYGAPLVPTGPAVRGVTSSSNVNCSSRRSDRSGSLAGAAVAVNTSSSVAGKTDNGSEWFQSFD